MNTTSELLADLFQRDLTRLSQQVEAFPDDVLLWKTVPGITNPGGNLVLHLEGNLREYIGRQLGHVAYDRNRPDEFSKREVPKVELLNRVEELRKLIPPIIRSLPAEKLAVEYPETVLEKPLTTEAFLIHLYGHLNWHMGQIDSLRRALSGEGAVKAAGL